MDEMYPWHIGEVQLRLNWRNFIDMGTNKMQIQPALLDEPMGQIKNQKYFDIHGDGGRVIVNGMCVEFSENRNVFAAYYLQLNCQQPHLFHFSMQHIFKSLWTTVVILVVMNIRWK